MIHCAWLPLILQGREHLWRACCLIPSIEITKAISLFTYTENTSRKTIVDKSWRLTFVESWKQILPQFPAAPWVLQCHAMPLAQQYYLWQDGASSSGGGGQFLPFLSSWWLLVFCIAPWYFCTLTHSSTILRGYGRLQWKSEEISLLKHMSIM